MIRDTASIAGRSFDLIVLGGGMFGVCIAWDAALRGLSVALVERGDIGHATSSNHFKLVHGGVRYLQHLDIHRVRTSSEERTALLRIAPHLVYPLPILMPAFGHGLQGRELLALGLRLHDLLTLRRNRGIDDPARRVPGSRHLSIGEVRDILTHLPDRRLSGGSIFYDAQIYNPPRLVLAFAQSAALAGARVLNYVEAERILVEDDRVVGIQARDRLSSESFEVRARVVVNAAGPWAHQLLDELPQVNQASVTPTFSRDLALVVRRDLDGGPGLALPTTTSRDAEALLDRGGRHLFYLPWRDLTLVGVWHKVFDGNPDRISVSRSEIEQYLQEANQACPRFELGIEDVCEILTGLVLFGNTDEQDDSGHSFGKRSIVLDHAEENDLEGLVTVIGVRATMARRVARRVVDIAVGGWEEVPEPASTAHAPVHGGDISSWQEHVSHVAEATGWNRTSRHCLAFAHNYGSEFQNVMEICRRGPQLERPLGSSTVLAGEIVYAVRHEMAVTLADAVMRRTELGTGCPPELQALEEAASLMARELGWTVGRKRAEVDAVYARLDQRALDRVYGGEAALPRQPIE